MRVQVNYNNLLKRKCKAHFQCERGNNMHKIARGSGAPVCRGWHSEQPVTQSACGNETQADPEGDRDEPGRSSNWTGLGIRAEGVGLNISLCNEMRTVNQYCWWRRWDVRVLRQQVVLPRETGDVRRCRTSPPVLELRNTGRVTFWIVHAVCNVGALWSWRLARSSSIAASKSGGERR